MIMDKISILTYLADNSVLVIPKYQREYCWKKENCYELFEDLKTIISNSNDRTHYMGAIISSQDGNVKRAGIRKNIIDGQQRLTTLSLLILAMIQLSKEPDLLNFEERDDFFPRADLENAIWNRSDRSGKKLILRHFEEGCDFQNYSNVVDFVKGEEIGKCSDNQTVIVRNFNYLYDLLLEYVSGKDPIVAGNELYDGLNKLVFIDITLDERDDPQQVFESMNATGMDLSEFDKCRNFFLINSNNVSDELLAAWNRIEQNLNEIWRNLHIDHIQIQNKFFYAYLKYHKQRANSTIKLRDKSYYNYIKSYINRYNDGDNRLMLNFLNEVALLSEKFNQMMLVRDPDPSINTVLQRMQYLDNTQFWPVIFALFLERNNGGLSNDDFSLALSAINSYIIRRAVCEKDTRASTGMSKYILRQLTSRNLMGQNKSEIVRSCILNPTVPSYSIPNDSEFQNHLYSLSYLDKRKLITTILWSIESYLRRNLNEIDCNNASIEHIMPQTLTQEWRTELCSENQNEVVEEVFSYWLHKLGNLTLTGYNSTYRNSSFEVKKSVRDEDSGVEIGFNSSAFLLNEFVRNCEHWTRSEIERRHSYLCDICSNIWSMPTTTININSSIDDIEFMLDEPNQDSDFSSCVFVDIVINNITIRNETTDSMDFVNSVVRYLIQNYPTDVLRIAEAVVIRNPNSSQHIAGQNDLISTTLISRQSWHELDRINDRMIYIKTRQQRGNFVSIVRRDFINIMSQCGIDLSNVVFHVRNGESRR